MESFKNACGKPVVLRMCAVVQQNKAYLSEIDGLIGDGDHGVNMNKGFTLCAERIRDQEMDLSEALKVLGTILLGEIGGSMGPLYGTFFRKMARACKGEDGIDARVVDAMLLDATAAVGELGGARVGDKTLMDVLIPAQSAFHDALLSGAPLVPALDAMKSAAEAGWQSTKDMQARIGRASRLGERSIGVLDAGATSCKLLLCEMADAMAELTA